MGAAWPVGAGLARERFFAGKARSHSQCLLPQSVPPLTVRTDSHNGYSCTRGGAVSGRRAYGSTMYTLPRAARLRNSMISM